MALDILTETYRQLGSRLRAMASSLLGNADDADDVLQDAFCKLWRQHHAITNSDSAAGLLTTTVRNTGIDRLRRRRPMADASDIPIAADESAESTDELYDAVTRLIETELTEKQQLILYQHDRDGWDYDEIAEYHGLTEANVRVIISRARRIIRTIYRQRITSRQ